eukprot:2916275-Prymnesium_polylepis.2
MPRVPDRRRLQHGVPARRRERAVERLHIRAAAGVLVLAVESDDARDQRAVAVHLLVRQSRRKLVLHHERTIDEQLLWRADRGSAKALASQRRNARQRKVIEPAQRVGQVGDREVSVRIGCR